MVAAAVIEPTPRVTGPTDTDTTGPHCFAWDPCIPLVVRRIAGRMGVRDTNYVDDLTTDVRLKLAAHPHDPTRGTLINYVWTVTRREILNRLKKERNNNKRLPTYRDRLAAEQVSRRDRDATAERKAALTAAMSAHSQDNDHYLTIRAATAVGSKCAAIALGMPTHTVKSQTWRFYDAMRGGKYDHLHPFTCRPESQPAPTRAPEGWWEGVRWVPIALSRLTVNRVPLCKRANILNSLRRGWELAPPTESKSPAQTIIDEVDQLCRANGVPIDGALVAQLARGTGAR